MKKSTLLLCTLAIFVFTLFNRAQAQITMIVHKSNSSNNLTLDELKNIYLGKVTTFSNNKRVVLAEYAPLKKRFYKVVLNKTIDKVKRYWISFVLSGKSANPPIEFKDVDEIKKFVSKNPGAICFIDISDIGKDMKVLTIEGKEPGEAKYPLK